MNDIYYRLPPVQWERLNVASLNSDDEHLGWQHQAYGTHQLIGGEDPRLGYLDSGVSRFHVETSGELNNLVEKKSFTNSNGWDQNNHGTGVHSVMAAKKNRSGMVGVAPGASVWSAQIFNRNGSGCHSDIADGLEWLAEQNLDAINFSGGSPHWSARLHDVARAVMKSGMLLFASCGNDGRRNDVDQPAADSPWSAVGSHDHELRRSGFSDYGPQLVTDSPGEFIYMCTAMGYGRANGTSFSSPFTAACFGRVRRKEMEIFGAVKTKTPEDVQSLIQRFHIRKNGLVLVMKCLEKDRSRRFDYYNDGVLRPNWSRRYPVDYWSG